MAILRNPVIRGFSPDPSVIRVGEWYYVATSSFEWFPTIPIHRSRDLVTWEYAGHVDGAVPQDSLAGVPDSGGIWAPALSWDGERFWVVYSIVRSVGTAYFDLDTWVSTATEAGGPWTAPRRVAGHGFDPSLFHHRGRLWLLNLQNDSRPGGRRFAGIVATELDRGTLRPVGGTCLLLQSEVLVEGPKLLARDGWFYLLLAEGGTGFEHAVRVARSRRITGPYEIGRELLLTSRDDLTLPLLKAGHGELVQATGGEWFLGHLAARPLRTADGPRCPLGRETAFQAVVWSDDGWPRLRQGGRHPDVEVEVPDVPAADTDAPPAVRGTDTVGWPWSTLRGRAEPSWVDVTGEPGTIRLRGRQSPESLYEHSLLAQRITELRADVQVTVKALPTSFTEAAGLVLWYDTTSYLSCHVTWAEPAGEDQHGQQWQGRGRTVVSLVAHGAEGGRVVAVRDVARGEPVTIAATVAGAEARFWLDRDGGRQPLGEPLDFSELSDDYGRRLRFTGVFAGIHAWDLVGGEFTAGFTGFRLECTP